MAFNRDDIYTSSGSVKLFNTWTPYVTKYDTSSFYNWEQDNLPLYDLEERTYELWEQNGFNTSTLTGMALTVSADAANTPEGQAALEANPNLFTTLSGCIAAVPKVVRCPVLIEVGTIGELGALELHNFRIEEGGSIEIINRAFGRSYNASAENAGIDTFPQYNESHYIINAVSSLDLSNALTDASCLDISTTVFSSTNDERVTSVYGFMHTQYNQRHGGLAVAIGGTSFYQGDANEFDLKNYEQNAGTATDNTLATLDISATNQFTGSLIDRGDISAQDKCAGNFYLNHLTKLSVKNCDGPIYIRNFFVDAATTRDIGVSINNSEVVLENCAAARAREAGFKFNNSKVILSRSAASYRNYKLTSTTTRADELGVGFHAVNSELILSATPTESGVGDLLASGQDFNFIASRNTVGFKLENSKLFGGYRRTTANSALTGGLIASELNTSAGIQLYNSNIDIRGLLDVYGNYRGIESYNSHVKFENLCVEYHTKEGLLADQSTFLFDAVQSLGESDRQAVEFKYNAQDLLLKNSSRFEFKRKDSIPQLFGHSNFGNSHGVVTWDAGTKFANLPTISVESGSHADLIHPNIQPRQTADMQPNSPTYGLAARAVGGSTLSLYGSKTGCNFVWGPAEYSYQKHVAGLYADDQSTINLHGPTVIAQFGVDVLTENQSTLNIEPPRVAGGWAYDASSFDLGDKENHTSVELHSTRACLVANKNSKINLKDLGSWAYCWNNTETGQAALTDTTDHDILTLGSSGITDYGGLQFYPNPQHETGITANNLDDIDTALGTNYDTTFPAQFSKSNDGAILQFLVKDDPILGTPDTVSRGKISLGGVCVRATGDSVVDVHNVNFVHGNQNSPLDGAYYDASGDLCERLMIWNMADNSRLNAAYCSVSGSHPYDADYHGPSALWVSSDGALSYVPASGSPAHTPETNVLSLLDSFGAGSAVLAVASGLDYNSPFNRLYLASGGPISLNDATAQLYAKAGVNVSSTEILNPGAPAGTTRNKGVFRLYFSVDPAANVLYHDNNGYSNGNFPHASTFDAAAGVVPQIFAQGYNFSGNVSATLFDDGTSLSSTYPQLVKLSYDQDGDGVPDTFWTSGYYYCKEFVRDNPTQCMLDESAAATFANAKNATLGSSGRPKKVTVYRAGAETGNTNLASEAYEDDKAIGLKSFNIFDLERDN
jgi:hypothetical protein